MSTLASVVLLGTASSMPTAGITGRIFYTTDTLQIFRDNGSSWQNVTPTGSSSALISEIQESGYIYANDTGVANAYVVTLTPTPTLVAGSQVLVKAAHANTGASTLVVNASAPISIVKNGSSALTGEEIAAGQIFWVVYDGTNFQLVNFGGSGSSGGTTLTEELVTFSGTSGTLSHTPNPSIIWLYRNSMKMSTLVTGIQGYSISGASITLDVAAGTGDVFDAVYYH